MSYDYTELQKVIFQWATEEEKISATCSKYLKMWTVSIISSSTTSTKNLKKSLEWTKQQLENWNCSSSDHISNAWVFTNKKDAEKFTLLFNLKWA